MILCTYYLFRVDGSLGVSGRSSFGYHLQRLFHFSDAVFGAELTLVVYLVLVGFGDGSGVLCISVEFVDDWGVKGAWGVLYVSWDLCIMRLHTSQQLRKLLPLFKRHLPRSIIALRPLHLSRKVDVTRTHELISDLIQVRATATAAYLRRRDPSLINDSIHRSDLSDQPEVITVIVVP